MVRAIHIFRVCRYLADLSMGFTVHGYADTVARQSKVCTLSRTRVKVGGLSRQ